MKTTAEKIQVMEAEGSNEEIQCCLKGSNEWAQVWKPVWNWQKYDYRIKPKPRECLVKFSQSYPSKPIGTAFINEIVDDDGSWVKMREVIDND